MPTSASRAPAASHGILPLVLRRARTDPGALAVYDGETALTYADLVAAARTLALSLRARGVAPGSAVGLLLPHSPRAVVAKLAIWWAGGHFVPLDAGYPPARARMMLDTAGAELTVGDRELAAAAGITAERTLVPPDPAGPHGEGAPAAAGSEAESTAGELPGTGGPDAVAYVMYTSGSTGRPKGVVLTHRGVAKLAEQPEYLVLTERDRVLFHSPMTFDASAFELWAALGNGAAVVTSGATRLSLDALVRDIERLGATVAFFTTALFHHLAAHDSPVFRLLRTLIVGGEALSGEHARKVLRACPWLTLINAYGPTEATTFTSLHLLRDGDCDEPPPIGQPVAGATAHVMDEAGRPVPADTVGELWIGGPRLARGYLGRPELTAERFVDHPGAGKLYRTGDLVSQRSDGTLYFRGRLDDQVKVRGFRMEPGEIEYALRAHPDLADAAVTVRRPSPDDAHLAAFYVPATGREPDPASLRDHLKQQLPPHMIPSTWTRVAELPLNNSGKVDRHALAELPAPGEAAAAGTAALSPIEQAVAELWSRALESPVTTADANFIALGGHSLLALGILKDLRAELGVDLTLTEFFSAETVADQAGLVEKALVEVAADDTGAEPGR
ncbi:amino acid adenylation domain-containing protein [Streptomyces sp. NPDC050759]|uniref:amino acid adenylation domain-containing protein n=1 Tax=Streptomyces sp. NPDC050759 TaxID=3365635 RepID=UPI00378A975B